MVKSTWQLKLLYALILGLLILGFYLPVSSFFLGKNPLNPSEELFLWKRFFEFFQDPWNLKILWFSFYQAFLSAFLSLLVGVPSAWIMSHYGFWGKRVFRVLTYLPFILPSILVVLGMILFFGNQGWINRSLMWLFSLEDPPIQFLYSLQGILIAHVFYNFPIVMKTVGDQWERLSFKYNMAGQSLGAGPWRVFFKIDLPLLVPSLLSSFALIFLLCLNSFAIILVLGGGLKYTNIEVLIYQLARIELDLQGAAALSFLQILLGLGFLFSLFRGGQQEVEQEQKNSRSLGRELRQGRVIAIFSCLGLGFILFFSFGPLLAIIVDSFQKFEGGKWVYTIEWYQQLFRFDEKNTFLTSLWNSLRIGISSALLSSVIGIGMAVLIHRQQGWKRKFLETFSLLPLGLSSVVFGVAWYSFFQEDLPAENLSLFLILVTMHSILTFPYWIRVVLPALDSIPVQWSMAAQSIGKNQIQYSIYILFPWLRRALLIAFFFSFSLSLGELNSTMMISNENLRTLPLEIYSAISGYHYSYASAVGVILLLLSVSSFILIEELFQASASSSKK